VPVASAPTGATPSVASSAARATSARRGALRREALAIARLADVKDAEYARRRVGDDLAARGGAPGIHSRVPRPSEHGAAAGRAARTGPKCN